MSPEKAKLDQLSNALFLSNRPIAEYLRSAVEGKLPDLMLPAFLHEATHHWTLTGLVGTALADMDVEVQRRWVKSPLVMDPQGEMLWAKIRASQQALEPLMEGIALFAEFDSYPGASEVISPVMEWLAYLFGRAEEVPSQLDPVERVKYLLCAYRTSEFAIRRKSDVLARPLDISNGGYLLGYLAVKSCFHSARKHSRRLADTELFLTYLRNFVFEDPGLVDILLFERTDEEGAFQQLIQRLHQRLKLLGSADLDERVACFEKGIVENGKVDWESVYVDAAKAESTRERLSARIRERASGTAAREEPDAWLGPRPVSAAGMERTGQYERIRRDMIAALAGADVPEALVDSAPMAHRPLVRISVNPVSISVSDDGVCTVNSEGSKLLEAPAAAQARAGSGDGTLAVYYLPDHLATALVCLRGSDLVCIYFPERVPERSRTIATVAIHQVLLSEQMRAAIKYDLVGQEDVIAEAIGFRPVADRAMTNLYLNFALAFVPDAKLDVCRRALEESGFWRILAEDGDAVRGLALLGLLSSYTNQRDLIEGIMRMHELDLAATSAALTAAQERYGYPLLMPVAGAPETRIERCLV